MLKSNQFNTLLNNVQLTPTHSFFASLAFLQSICYILASLELLNLHIMNAFKTVSILPTDFFH